MKAVPEGPSAVVENAQSQRYELSVDGALVFADYRREPGRVLITHVETPAVLRGRGLAAVLMQGIVDRAGEAKLTVVPICSYAQAWMQQHRA